MSSRRHVGLTVVTNVVLAAVNAVTGIALARLLGPELRGELAAIMLWGVTLGAVAAVGVPEAVVYAVARARDQAGRTWASAAALNLLTASAFTAGAWFLVPFVLGQQSQETKELAQLFVLVIPIYVLGGLPANVLRGSADFARWNALRTLAPLLWLATVAVAWSSDHFTVSFLTGGFLVSQASLLVVASAVAWPAVAPPFRVEPHRWRPMLRFGLPGVVSTIPATANLRLDQMLMAAFVSNERLGLYVTAVAWAGLLAPVLAAFGAVLFPRLAGETDRDLRMQVLGRGLRMAVLVAAALVIMVAVATPLGIGVLFGSAYLAAIPAAVVLVVAGGVLAVTSVVEDAWRGLGRPAEILRAEVGGFVVSALLLAGLLPALGIVGAAAASLGGYTATLTILLVRLRATEAVELSSLVPGRAELADLVATIARTRPGVGSVP